MTLNPSHSYIVAQQAQKKVMQNEPQRKLHGIVQLAVLDRDLAMPPALDKRIDRQRVKFLRLSQSSTEPKLYSCAVMADIEDWRK